MSSTPVPDEGSLRDLAGAVFKLGYVAAELGLTGQESAEELRAAVRALKPDPAAPAPGLVGVTLSLWIATGRELQSIVQSLLAARALRCLSPHRTTVCHARATSILWQDHEEWYPCCDQHRDAGPQWCGSTRFAPQHVSFEVIPAEAFAWLATLTSEHRERLGPRCEIYDRTE